MSDKDKLFNLRYPVGEFIPPAVITDDDVRNFIDEIEKMPSVVEKELHSIISSGRTDCSYREGGWSARQLVHHIADSHMNAFIRFKLAMTEDHPAIKPYMESRWGDMADNKTADPLISLELLKALHQRWVYFLRTMKSEDFNRTYFHPESQKDFNLKTVSALYAWHSRHHAAHLKIISR